MNGGARSPTVAPGPTDLPWSQATFCVLDLEMTGLDRKRDRICEVGLVRVEQGVVVDRYSQLVNPGVKMSPGARKVHGLRDDQVAEAPPFGQIAAEVVQRLHGAVLVGHNTRFDLDYLLPALQRTEAGRGWAAAVEALPRIDTLLLSRRLFSYRDNRLDQLTALLDIDRARSHRALDDALATQTLLFHLLDALDPDGTCSVDQIQARLASRVRGSDELKAQRAKLVAAFRARQTVEIAYLSRSDATARDLNRRRVDIWRMGRRRLQGFCHWRGEERVFHLDRIEAVEATDEAYQIPRFRARI